MNLGFSPRRSASPSTHLTSLAALSLLVAAACSRDADAGDAEGSEGSTGDVAESSDSSGDDGIPCQDDDATMQLPGVEVAYFDQQIDVAPEARSVLADGSVLVLSYDAELAAHLSFVRPGADSSNVELASSAEAYGYEFAAVALDFGGDRCAVYVRSGETLKFACEGGTPEDSGVEMSAGGGGNAGRGLVPLALPDGSLVVYGQGRSASYDAAMRDATGSWQEVEKNESSISWADDAVLHLGQPVTCFIGAGGSASIDMGAQKVGLGLASNRCRMLATADRLHLLLSDGHVSLAWDALLPAAQPTPVDVGTSDPGPLFALGDHAYVIADRGTSVDAVPLTGGDAIALDAEGALDAMRVDGSIFRGVSSETVANADGSVMAEIRMSTRCLD